MSYISEKIASLSPSPTLAISEKAQRMQNEGIDVISFGAGQPDFPTPDHIVEAACQALEEGYTRYTPVAGLPELRSAVCDKLLRDSGLEYSPEQVVVSCGAKHSLYNIFQVICDPGDEVLVPAPYWVSYTAQVELAGAEPVIIDTLDSEFKVTVDRFQEQLSERTKALILNSPSNPTGAVYSAEELQDIAELCVENDILIISDEIYEKILYDGREHVSPAGLSPEIKGQVILVNGVSKSHAMTGWRIGYTVAEKTEIISSITKLQSQSTSNPAAVSQKAAEAAICGSDDSVEEMVEKFVERRDYITNALMEMPGVDCRIPGGAFYVFPDFSGHIGTELGGRRIEDSFVLAEVLLDEAQVAAVPGGAFGAEGYLRFSYATSLEKIQEGMERLQRLLA